MLRWPSVKISGPVVAAADERIVRRHRPVVFEAQHLAGEAHAILRRRAGGIGVADGRVAVADRHVDHAVLAERRFARRCPTGSPRRGPCTRRAPRRPSVARASVMRQRGGSVARGRPLPVRQRSAVRSARRLRLVIREVDQLVLGEPRMEREVHQAGEPGRLHLRQAGDRRRIEHAVADDAQASGALGDEDAAVGQKRHAPRLVEALGDDEPNLVLDGRVHHDRSVGQAAATAS